MNENCSQGQLTLGCHLSISKGFLKMAQTAVSIDANTFQFFTRNPRGGAAKAVNQQDIDAFAAYCAEQGIHQVLAHAPYTLNAASANEQVRAFAFEVLADDLRRMEHTPHQMYNFHPGGNSQQSIAESIEQVAEVLNTVLSPGQTTMVLLETMAGKGSEVGASFDDLAQVIARVELESHLGVCLDTCHVWDAGYDIVNNLDGVLEEFDSSIGLGRLRAIHLNDSLNERGSHKDRHAKIGEGKIGFEALARITNHPMLRHLPFYLETPNELPGYADEISRLRARYLQ
ncbi:MAG: deoxyribonuclease IV [Eggerthellaceae bacterium]|jgi:deoxyribonuclease-4|nr:deoxyribonuclease IV [Eggerthellaceae bacterium]MDR2721909.1 deoxyribonuclease IV [Coriobacteriaceae bacterium]